MLDYDVDSDEEWEIPEGDDCDESIKSDDDEEVVFSCVSQIKCSIIEKFCTVNDKIFADVVEILWL